MDVGVGLRRDLGMSLGLGGFGMVLGGELGDDWGVGVRGGVLEWVWGGGFGVGGEFEDGFGVGLRVGLC